ncbi:MAG: chromosome segregation protein SMC [Pseudomonadota bacterium]
MRLTKLKLVGFKSFVDPTVIELPGQLVGVVGPNGCGKSNVIDAVRWVLGESKASELRGESMQDVIFNGSTGRQARKPVSRAVVELVFDNSLGRMLGQWSQYAELSVRRLLTRSGQSEYFINQQQVRRKDITDLFLGTGLGPRAYAIIGQGTIARIIEARPEELRVFLEEAAGVSKYKERRKETERRIADTRDNLTRLADVRSELDAQMSRLEAQAAVARQYRADSAALASQQQLLCLLRQRDAQLEAERFSRDLVQAELALEAQTGDLRAAELALEQARAAHFAASDALHHAQTALFAANAEVAGLEAELRHRRQAQSEYATRLAQLSDDQTHWQAQAEQCAADAVRYAETLLEAEAKLEQVELRLAEQQEHLPLAEERYAAAQSALNRQRAQLRQVEQALQLEETHSHHAQRALLTLAGRRERLYQERAALPQPDAQALVQKDSELTLLRAAIAEQQRTVQAEQQQLPLLEQARKQALTAVQQAQQQRSASQARRVALLQLQQRVQNQGALGAWLRRHGLAEQPALWQSLVVAPGWEEAFESVLRERLSALRVARFEAAWAEPRPPGKLSLLLPAVAQTQVLNSPAAPATIPPTAQEATQKAAQTEPWPQAQANSQANLCDSFDSLRAQVRCDDPQLALAMDEWLTGVCVAPDLPSALATRATLPVGACCVTAQGDQVTRHSLLLFAPDAAEHGLLERQREIDNLAVLLEQQQEVIEQAQSELALSEELISERQQVMRERQQHLNEQQDRAHALQLTSLQLTQALARFNERQGQIDQLLAEMDAEQAEEDARLAAAEQACVAQRARCAELRDELRQSERAFEQSEAALRDERAQLSAVERAVQSAQFAQRECANKCAQIASNQALSVQQLAKTQDALAQCTQRASAVQVVELEPQLEQAILQRSAAETALAQARSENEAASSRLRLADEQRLQCERAVAPLRERISDLQLKTQAARLSVRQYLAQLEELLARPAMPAMAAQAEATHNQHNQHSNHSEQNTHSAEQAPPAALEQDEASALQRLAELAAQLSAARADELSRARVSTLQSSMQSLQRAIEALGSVNLAALSELEAARERKLYLDAQALDLGEAMETLENAIRRIDRETRDLLQTTYDAVNGHFGSLFPTLFGGGEARLIMSGEEILDAGIQVMAQPPGKKNATIHLLSGGEKALTAIALVFALFQLNPAPFCLLDEVDAPLDDSNTERFCAMVRRMSAQTQFLFISHSKIAMEMAQQLVGVTMQESGVSRIVAVDLEDALRMREGVA